MGFSGSSTGSPRADLLRGFSHAALVEISNGHGGAHTR
jgi:hypothetical protein